MLLKKMFSFVATLCIGYMPLYCTTPQSEQALEEAQSSTVTEHTHTPTLWQRLNKTPLTSGLTAVGLFYVLKPVCDVAEGMLDAEAEFCFKRAGQYFRAGDKARVCLYMLGTRTYSNLRIPIRLLGSMGVIAGLAAATQGVVSLFKS